MKSLVIQNLGPISHADITFGDLTVLVGPQASGKSLFVQTYKALADAKAIRTQLKSYGFDWQKSEDQIGEFCESYFGGGTASIVRPETKLVVDGRARALRSIALPQNGPSSESTYLIPAQRVLMLQNGWPRPFMGFETSDPYSLKQFSESVRILMERGLGRSKALFPQPKRLKADLKGQIAASIYFGGELQIASEGARKRIILAQGKSQLAVGAWSAGQREFTPLLLGLYWLMPSTKTTKQKGISTVIIEEPEMGLHPQAIVSFGLLTFELLARGYKVIVSTHSPVILDLVWMMRELGQVSRGRAMKAFKQVFGLETLGGPMRGVFEDCLEKVYQTYFFERAKGGVRTKDISELDPGSEDADIAGWGGLSGFSGRIAEAIAEATRYEQ